MAALTVSKVRIAGCRPGAGVAGSDSQNAGSDEMGQKGVKVGLSGQSYFFPKFPEDLKFRVLHRLLRSHGVNLPPLSRKVIFGLLFDHYGKNGTQEWELLCDVAVAMADSCLNGDSTDAARFLVYVGESLERAGRCDLGDCPPDAPRQ